MISSKDTNVASCNNDADSEKRAPKLEDGIKHKPTPGLIPITPTSKPDSFQNAFLKITEVKSLTATLRPKLGRPKQIRYKILPNGHRIKIVPKRSSLVKGPSILTNRPPPIPSSRPVRSDLGVNQLRSGNSGRHSLPNRLSAPTRIFANRTIQSRSIPKRASTGTSGCSSSTNSITKITTKEKLISNEGATSSGGSSGGGASMGSSSSSKRKSQHVTKPVSEITFEESVEVVRNENTALMEYVACLRVALNNLLSEVDCKQLDLPGAIGKVKIPEKVEQILHDKKEENLETEDELKNQSVESVK